MNTAITVNRLDKRYGAYQALKGLTMRVPEGSIYGLVGQNGAGKTTLIRIICGLQAPTAGGYSLFGIDSREKTISKARRRMGAVVETPAIYMDITAEDNLRTQCRTLGIPSFEGIPEILRFVGLSDTANKKAKYFSLGMRQRLGIAVALIGDPDLIVLDEPVNGLDPRGIVEIRELLLKLNRERRITLLISSHILDELSRLATHYGFIHNGAMVKEITAEALNAACRKCVRIDVTSTKALARVLDGMKLEYRILNDAQADIFAKPNITRLTAALAEQQCEVLSLWERDETLESYYMNLLGGNRHA